MLRLPLLPPLRWFFQVQEEGKGGGLFFQVQEEKFKKRSSRREVQEEKFKKGGAQGC